MVVFRDFLLCDSLKLKKGLFRVEIFDFLQELRSPAFNALNILIIIKFQDTWMKAMLVDRGNCVLREMAHHFSDPSIAQIGENYSF